MYAFHIWYFSFSASPHASHGPDPEVVPVIGLGEGRWRIVLMGSYGLQGPLFTRFANCKASDDPPGMGRSVVLGGLCSSIVMGLNGDSSSHHVNCLDRSHCTFIPKIKGTE